MHGCLFDNGYLNVLYGTRFLDGGQQLFNVAIIAGGGLYLGTVPVPQL